MPKCNKTIKVGTISGLELLLKSPRGHKLKDSGCGYHRNIKKDKRLRRENDKRYCKDYS